MNIHQPSLSNINAWHTDFWRSRYHELVEAKMIKIISKPFIKNHLKLLVGTWTSLLNS